MFGDHGRVGEGELGVDMIKTHDIHVRKFQRIDFFPSQLHLLPLF